MIAANDEFFAERENLLIRERAVFDPEHFGHKGKIMDGWETRRRRGADADHPFPAPEDHDWAIVRLGAPGIVRGLVVDTAHFRGNYPQRVSVQAISVEGAPGPERLLADDVKWEEILPPTPCAATRPTPSRSRAAAATPTSASASTPTAASPASACTARSSRTRPGSPRSARST